MTNIKFRCGSDVLVDAEWDETVLDALLRSGVPVPFYCRSGICGQCKSQLAQGEVTEIGTAPSILTEDEVRRGTILICRSIALTDCEIIPENLPKQEHELPWPEISEVVAADWPTPGLFHFQVRIPEDGEVPSFLFHPGQYSFLLDQRQPKSALPSRLYPATRPGHGFLDFYLPIVGADDRQAFEDEFHVGARLRLARPVGASALKEGEKGPVIIVAEDAGLPGVMSMIELLRISDKSSSLRVVIRGDVNGYLEQQLATICAESAIKVSFVEASALDAELQQAVHDLAPATPAADARLKAYVKGGNRLVSESRKVFYASGLRAWEVHADILEAMWNV